MDDVVVVAHRLLTLLRSIPLPQHAQMAAGKGNVPLLAQDSDSEEEDEEIAIGAAVRFLIVSLNRLD